MRNFLIFLLMLAAKAGFGQNTFTAVVTDSASKATLPGVTVKVKNTALAAAADLNGKIKLSNIPNGKQILVFTYTGYDPKELTLVFPLKKPLDVIPVQLMAATTEVEEVIVSSTRTNSRIEDLPMKVEVLGQEEMEEENQVKPASVASILGDLSVIHVQQTSAVSGNTTIRMQGLDGRYTQLLRDGLPLFDGLSGNFGVLSIPPLDLKQIEIIKGSSSTLYGGGAIAGLINFISKTPTAKPTLSFTLNRSSLKENNVNAYYSQKFGKTGVTLLAQQTVQNAVDVNKDGFSDVPQLYSTIIHPRFFYYASERSRFDAGYAFTYEDRSGGDIQVINNQADVVHRYLEQDRSARNTFDFHYQNTPDTASQFTIKGSASNYNLNSLDDGFRFKGNQLLDYLEVSQLVKTSANDLVFGANYTGEYFTKTPDASPLANYTYHTIGGFIQDGWHVSKKLLFESGLRTDHHNVFGWFVLPRIAFLYQPQQGLSIRLASGLGYKAPNIFIPETLSGGFSNLLPVTNALKSERSLGINFDINYHVAVGEEASFDIDQALYYTRITDPLIPVLNANGTVSLSNVYNYIRSAGTDTYARFVYKELEVYLGFNHTVSKELNTNQEVNLPFSPQNKLSAAITYEIPDQWRFGIESSYESVQYININQRVKNTPFAAVAIERKFGPKVSVVLNCENLGDFRQSRYEQLYTGTITHPVFNQLWAPIDGRVVNLALRLKLL